MKHNVFSIALTFSLVLGSLLTTTVNAQESQLTVIGNFKSVPSEMDIDQLKSVLKGEKLHWDDGTKVVVALMMSKTTTGADTCKRLYNMTPNELRRYFRMLDYRGEGDIPSFCETVAEMEAFVSKTPGAIGVVQTTRSEAVQIINIDGKKSL